MLPEVYFIGKLPKVFPIHDDGMRRLNGEDWAS
jgi:hypothetical protein